MDKKTAQQLIEKTFNDSFNEEQFTIFAKNLLNDLEPKSNIYSGNLLWDDYKEHINSYKRIGKYIDPQGDALDVLIVEVKSINKLERARTALRNFVIKHLTKFEKDYALVAFYSKEDGGDDWRFSFVKLEYRSELDEEVGKVKTKKDFTPAKRYSFLVGKYEKSHTANNQLLPLLQNIANNPTITDLENAFSIEKVTQEFFNQYKDLYVKLLEHFKNDKHIQAELEKSNIDNARFTKKLLGQIVFLYFLQKKGWLGVNQYEKWGTGNKRFVQDLFDIAETEKVNFFKDKLQYLFYEALAKERDNDNSFYEKLNCRIPFLNGGLFEADYDWATANITIPTSLFRTGEEKESERTGILDVFGRYNFTIKEDEPLDKEVAVDPEMLGKVFENMLEITERKSKGAFYTPREIVHYMCQESLINYLDNSLNDATQSYQAIDSDQIALFGGSANKKGQAKIEIEHKGNILIPKTDIEDYIREGHFALENDQRVASKGETKTYQYQLPESIRLNAELIDQKLSDILICDPAIGSGAFPVGLLHELVNAQLVLKPHFGLNYLKEKLDRFGFKESESINESRYIYRLKRHIIQESIYGVDIDASAIDIARLRLWLSLVVDEDDLDPIETLPNLDYKIVCGNSLIGMPEDIFPNLEVLEEIEALKPSFYDETNEKKKKELRQIISSKIRELLDQAEHFSGYKIDFDFKLHFSEVWHKKGGFDVVIGNPPYGLLNKKQNQNFAITVNSEHLDYFKTSKKFESAKGGVINVFRLFITQSGILLNKNGVFAEIFPLAYTGDVTSKSIREHNLKNFSIIGIEAFPERDNENKRVFKHAKMSVAILFFTSKNKPTNKFYLRTHSDKYVDHLNEKVFLTKTDITKLDPNYFTIPVLSKFDLKILSKVYLNRRRISDITNCYTGEIDLSLDKKYLKESAGFSTLLKGAIIGRYEIRLKMSQGDIMYLDSESYLKNNNGTRSTHYQFDRIGMQGITGVNEKIRLKMTLVPKGTFLANSVNYILMPEGLNQNKLALLQLNSELHNYIFKLTSTNSNVNGYEINNLPLISNTPHKDNINIIVDYILFTTRINPSIKHSIQSIFFDSLSSAICYELYFAEEFKMAGKEILKHLFNLKPINDKMTEEEKLAIIQAEFERLYDDRHPVKFAIETLESIEEVRIIKEALK